MRADFSPYIAHNSAMSNCHVALLELHGGTTIPRRGMYMRPNIAKTSTLAMILVGSVSLGGCATKGYVNQQIATVNARIDGIDGHLRTVDATAGQALAQAQAAAGQAQQNGQKIDQVNARVDGLDQQVQLLAKQKQRRPRG